MKSKPGKLIAHLSLIAIFSFIPGAVYGQTGGWGSLTSAAKNTTGFTGAQAATATKLAILQVPNLQNLQQLSDSKKIACTSLAKAFDRVAQPFEGQAVTPNSANSIRNFFQSSTLRSNICVSVTKSLQTALDTAWANFRVPILSDPIVATPAVLFSSINFNQVFQRDFGLMLGTLTPGLPNACNDIYVVPEQLMHQYVKAIVEGEHDQALETLEGLATASACMNELEYAFFGQAWLNSWKDTADRLDAHNASRVKSLLAKLLAPVALPFYDVCKAQGEKCAFYQWFKDPEVQQAIQSGWAENYIRAYNRKDGSLISFPVDRTASAQICRSVDLPTFIASLTDPRAIQDGSCGLAEMICAGPQNMPGGQPRYLCPRECGRGSAPAFNTSPNEFGRVPVAGNVISEARQESSGGANTFATSNSASAGAWAQFNSMAGITSRWPSLTGADFDAINSLCRPSGSLPPQGPTSTEGDCSNLTPPTTPQDQYLQCVYQAVGEPTDAGSTTIDFLGVPTGNQCRHAGSGISGDGDTVGGGGRMTVAGGENTVRFGDPGQKMTPEFKAFAEKHMAETKRQIAAARAVVPVGEEVTERIILQEADTIVGSLVKGASKVGAAAGRMASGLLGVLGAVSILFMEVPAEYVQPVGTIPEGEIGPQAGIPTTGEGLAVGPNQLHGDGEDEEGEDKGQAGRDPSDESPSTTGRREGAPDDVPLPEDMGHIGDCFADTNCRNNPCTAMAEVNKANECSSQLLSAGMEAMGRPKLTPGSTRPRVDPRLAIYDSEQAPVAPLAGDCLPAAAPPPAAGASMCDFVMCSGALASLSGGCCGANSGFVMRAIGSNCPPCGPGGTPYILPNGRCGECIEGPTEAAPPPGPLPRPRPDPAGGFTMMPKQTFTTQPIQAEGTTKAVPIQKNVNPINSKGGINK